MVTEQKQLSLQYLYSSELSVLTNTVNILQGLWDKLSIEIIW